jgi:methionine synthase II (cobalamin-independent)
VSVENKRSDELDYCPHCERLLEIAAINLTLSGRNVALFICPNCGLARAETRNEARSKLRHLISALERLLWELKYWVQRS